MLNPTGDMFPESGIDTDDTETKTPSQREKSTAIYIVKCVVDAFQQ